MGKVRNILQGKNQSPIFVCPDNTVYQALELMCDKSIGALLVMEDGEFVGIFTERDYARKVILKGRASKETLIREIMTETPITVTPDNSVEDCMRIMTNKFIRHLPVLDNGRLVGLISIGDLVKFIIEEQKFIIENMEHYIKGEV
jgi:CBS domain-containing protein